MSFFDPPLTGNDWALLKDIRLKALATDLDAYGPAYAAEINMSQDDWREWISLHQGDISVLLEDEQVVGAGGVIVNKADSAKKHIILRCFFCDPRIHRHGLLKMFLRAAEDLAHKHPGVDRLLFSHPAANAAMRAAAVEHNFNPTHQREKILPDGTVEIEHHYELPLNHLAEPSL